MRRFQIADPDKIEKPVPGEAGFLLLKKSSKVNLEKMYNFVFKRFCYEINNSKYQ